MNMKPRQLAITIGVCVVGIGLLFLGWYYYTRSPSLGKITEKEVEELFKDSKVRNSKDANKDVDGKDKGEVTGPAFFKYIKRYLELLKDDQHALNSIYIVGAYDGKTDKPQKGELIKNIIEQVIKIMFEDMDKDGKSKIADILKLDIKDLIKEAGNDKEKAKVIYAKIFIINLLKTVHDYQSGSISESQLRYVELWEVDDDGGHSKDKYTKEFLQKLTKDFSGEDIIKKKLYIEVKCNPNDLDEYQPISIYEFLCSEIFLLAKLIPYHMVKTSKTDDYGVELNELNKRYKDQVSQIDNEEQNKIKGTKDQDEIDKIKAEYDDRRKLIENERLEEIEDLKTGTWAKNKPTT